MNWEPIDSAPFDDGEYLLVCLIPYSDGSLRPEVKIGWRWNFPMLDDDMEPVWKPEYHVGEFVFTATHWMPLPKLPA